MLMLHVQSGISRLVDVEAAPVKPDFITASIADLRAAESV